MKRKQRRKLAIKLAKIELKKLGAPRHRLKMFVDVIMRDIKVHPERYVRHDQP